MPPPQLLGRAFPPHYFTTTTILTTRAQASTHSTSGGGSGTSRTGGGQQNQQQQGGKRKSAAQKQRQQPSVLEVQRAIGVIDGDNGPEKSTGGGGSSSLMDMLASTPIGQPESSLEKKIRETGEWVVDNTESRALQGQKVLLVVCLKILPVWLFFLLVAAGVVELPFSAPFLDNLLS